MKKQIILSLVLSAALLCGVNSVSASETDKREAEFFSDSNSTSDNLIEAEGLFSDGETVKSTKNNKAKTKEFVDASEEIMYSGVDDYKQNNIELNTYYDASKLTDSWGYLLRLNIPENGRIK